MSEKFDRNIFSMETFNKKIDFFRSHPKYEWLNKYAYEALVHNEGCGYYQIKAADFINRIESASLEYIEEWLDGKNKLEWSGIK